MSLPPRGLTNHFESGTGEIYNLLKTPSVVVNQKIKGLVPNNRFSNDTLSMQRDLAALGYDLEGGKQFKNDGVDGYYGNATKNAVMAFQRNHGLDPTGIATTETLMAMREQALANENDGLEPNNKFSDATQDMQKDLAALGYDLEDGHQFKDDGVDGLYGKVTKSAVAKFQKDNGFKQTGIATTETLAAMHAHVIAQNIEPAAVGNVAEKDVEPTTVENVTAPDIKSTIVEHVSEKDIEIDGLVPNNDFSFDTKEMQEKLAALHYDLEQNKEFDNNGVDGLYGDITKDAVENFQEDNGLDPTGEATPETLAALEEQVKAQGVEYVPGMETKDPSLKGSITRVFQDVGDHVAQSAADFAQDAGDFAQDAGDLAQSAGNFLQNNVRALLDYIAKPESNGDYNVAVGGKRYDLENMTINEVQNLQADVKLTDGTPMGKYQIKDTTLSGLKKNMNLTGNELFDRDMQDQMGVELLKGRGLNKYLKGDIDTETFADNISKEWAGVPNSTGNSHYKNIANNAAGVSRQEFVAAVEKIKAPDEQDRIVASSTSPAPVQI